MNALYANFFTGLSTPEELYRTLDSLCKLAQAWIHGRFRVADR